MMTIPFRRVPDLDSVIDPKALFWLLGPLPVLNPEPLLDLSYYAARTFQGLGFLKLAGWFQKV